MFSGGFSGGFWMYCCYMWGGWGGGGAKRVKGTAYNQEKHFIKAVHVKSSLESK